MKKGIIIVLIVICAIVFGISAYQLINYYGKDRAAEKAFEQLLPGDIGSPDATTEEGGGFNYDSILAHYKALKADNGDMVGWLRIPGTRVSYPVMQTPNSPEYYLDKNFKKEYTVSGTLFASANCDVDLPSDVVTIYGHRMKTGAMFGSLGDFLDADFFAKNQKVVFDTFVGRSEYKIYCVFVEAVNTGSEFKYYNYSDFASEEIFDEFMSGMRANIQIQNYTVEPVYGDKFLLLSTCEYTHQDGRMIVVAVRV
jgi:sortase B